MRVARVYFIGELRDRERREGRLPRVRSRRLGAGDPQSLGTGDNLLRRSDGGSERHEHTVTTHNTPGFSRDVRPASRSWRTNAMQCNVIYIIQTTWDFGGTTKLSSPSCKLQFQSIIIRESGKQIDWNAFLCKLWPGWARHLDKTQQERETSPPDRISSNRELPEPIEKVYSTKYKWKALCLKVYFLVDRISILYVDYYFILQVTPTLCFVIT